MPRMFVGIDVPELLKADLSAQCGKLDSALNSRVKWTGRENWHITLKFLGYVADDQLEPLKAALANIPFSPFIIRLGSSFCFPNMRKPRVVGLELSEGANRTAALATQVDLAVHGLGFKREQKDFKAHLTLGRVKRVGDDEWESVLRRLTLSQPTFTVDHFILWESKLTQSVPIYHVRGVFPSAQ